MREQTRVAVRLSYLLVMVVALGVLAHSYAVTVGGAVGAAGAASPSTETPVGLTTERHVGDDAAVGGGIVDVESRFNIASGSESVGDRWTASRLDRATRDGRNVTVVATQGFSHVKRGVLGAFLPNGSLVYYDDQYPVYFDVDPAPSGRYTVEYVAGEHPSPEECEAVETTLCTRNIVERVNLSTGERDRVYDEITPRIYSTRWHDVDRVNESTIVIADIANDAVRAVDTRDGSVRWWWNASENYTREQGGADGDWTHINDVEVLADGRVMVSVRNMDSAVFLDVEDGEAVMDDDWTLGTDDDHDVLYEQHNPDYISSERGGPAVVVADSERGRVVEYQWVDGAWEQRWQWRDARLQWPRDADRLPGGTTLLVDSHGNRVLEVAPDGRVVWAARVSMPYDVERLGTGDESAGGESMSRLRERATSNGSGAPPPTGSGYGPAVPPSTTAWDYFWMDAKDATPSLLANGLLYMSPPWIRFTDLAFLSMLVLTGVVWGGTELYWSDYSVRAAARGRVAAARRSLRRLSRRLRRLQRRLQRRFSAR